MPSGSAVRIGCWTGVRGRELFLRTCLMQMLLQTRQADHYVVLVNGEDAANYDYRAVSDLIEPWVSLVTMPKLMSTVEVSTAALELLLQNDVQLFFKIDSDDLYFRNYLQTFVDYVESAGLHKLGEGFCLNLIDQLWLKAQPGGGAAIREQPFYYGLGLSDQEKAKGMRVGAPPTFVFDRTAAKLLVEHSHRQPYAHLMQDDRVWRHILFDHGIIIQQVSTPQPVFGYLRHSSNSCVIHKKKGR